MKLPFFTTFVLFTIWTTYQLHKHSHDEDDVIEEFVEKERRANATRKKSLDQLPYVTIPLDSMPLHNEISDERITEYIDILEDLSNKKIVNLTGQSNTELKLAYGAPNITKLTEYDSNYTRLVRTLARLGDKYMEYKLFDDARLLFEYAISIGSDVRSCYEKLADLYSKNGEYDKIEQLKASANQLDSLSKAPILRYLDGVSIF